MSSVRLCQEQIERLKASDNASALVRYAVKRWRRRDFVIPEVKPKKTAKIVLQIFPLKEKPEGIADWQIREILDRHFSVRDTSRDAEIARLDWEIAEMFKLLPPFIIEGDMEL